MNKPRILIFTSYYKPGFKGGGPIKSISNIVNSLGNKYMFDIVTLDRDLGDSSSYKNIKVNQWNKLTDETNVFYYSQENINMKKFLQIIRSENYKVIYLNSLFSKQTRIITFLNRLQLISSKIVIAPRGEVETGALKIKSNKKKLFLRINKIINMYKNIYWHATNIQEKIDIEKQINSKNIYIASNISDDLSNNKKDLIKTPGSLKVVFISRISPKKNLELALKAFKSIEGDVLFDIYGPLEDIDYFNKCKNIAEKLPSNISVIFKGGIKPEEIKNTLSKYHFFIFPTLGENYGHVIYEALSSKVPVITTKNVPENNLYERNLGFNLSYNLPEWIDVLQSCVDMTQDEMEVFEKNLDQNLQIISKNRKESIEKMDNLLRKVINGIN